ncbi:hypothetical protein AC249_AIPGENE6099 [Exaiptasia diaphana]|nr:hypothetical protein AC249_AIPGENE6099 [Exaiptasia diaphana]
MTKLAKLVILDVIMIMRDLLRLGLDEMVESFKPPLRHDMYKIEFVPVARPSGSESVVTRKLIEDRYVIEILLIKYTGLIYTTPHGKCFFRHKSANIELTTQEVRERTIQEQETSYNEEIKRILPNSIWVI